MSSVRLPCATATIMSPSSPRVDEHAVAAEENGASFDHRSGNGARESAGSACAETQSGVVAYRAE